jgi:transcriptional/translational regulatory protein YebC/TACO1
MLQILTDNRNRTVAEIRNIFGKHGGNLGENGCVGWMFSKKGAINVDKSASAEDKLFEIALEAGADDISDGGEAFEVTTAPDVLEDVRARSRRPGSRSCQRKSRWCRRTRSPFAAPRPSTR